MCIVYGDLPVDHSEKDSCLRYPWRSFGNSGLGQGESFTWLAMERLDVVIKVRYS